MNSTDVGRLVVMGEDYYASWWRRSIPGDADPLADISALRIDRSNRDLA